MLRVRIVPAQQILPSVVSQWRRAEAARDRRASFSGALAPRNRRRIIPSCTTSCMALFSALPAANPANALPSRATLKSDVQRGSKEGMRQCRWLRYLIARGQTPAASDDSHAQGKSHCARNPGIRREAWLFVPTLSCERRIEKNSRVQFLSNESD